MCSTELNKILLLVILVGRKEPSFISLCLFAELQKEAQQIPSGLSGLFVMLFWPVRKKKLTFARAGHWVGKLLTFVVTWVVKVGLPMSLEVTCDVGST